MERGKGGWANPVLSPTAHRPSRLYPSRMPSIPDLRRLLEKDPSDPFLLYGLAQEYAKLGDTGRAVEFYDKCLAADPAYCYAYFHKARAQQQAGQQAEAIATLRAGLAAAKKAGDSHAASELSGLLDEIE